MSTTRPELLNACVAVFVNPTDERYIHLIGQETTTPFGTTVEILADDKVDVTKGTGIVMCCSYGDETDMYWIKKHGLKEKVILDRTGSMIGTGDASLDGLYYKKARKVVVEKLNADHKVVDAKDIQHDVGTHERCSTPIEILTVKQWFIKTLELKNELLVA
ncbi:class I tRNA ligase family protein [Patescibacteria group bacterium]|nr:class I tRNA ligase family protein [Patescibacteria group bacterium]